MVNNLTKEEVFNAIAGTMSYYGGLFKAIMEEQGLEKALKLHAKQSEPIGNMRGEQLKQALGGKDLDMRILSTILEPSFTGFGISAEIEVDPTTLTAKVSKCPSYDGFQMAGLDHQTIVKMCQASALATHEMLNKHFPEIYNDVQVKETPNGICVEKFYIKK